MASNFTGILFKGKNYWGQTQVYILKNKESLSIKQEQKFQQARPLNSQENKPYKF